MYTVMTLTIETSSQPLHQECNVRCKVLKNQLKSRRCFNRVAPVFFRVEMVRWKMVKIENCASYVLQPAEKPPLQHNVSLLMWRLRSFREGAESGLTVPFCFQTTGWKAIHGQGASGLHLFLLYMCSSYTTPLSTSQPEESVHM